MRADPLLVVCAAGVVFPSRVAPLIYVLPPVFFRLRDELLLPARSFVASLVFANYRIE